MNTLNKIEIQLPFSGFYDSMHDMHIDNFIEHEIEYLENELNYTSKQLSIISNRFYTMDYSAVRKAVCEHYIKAFNAVFYDEYNIHLDLKYSKMISPRFYNFETDRLYAFIDESIYKEVVTLVNKKDFKELLSDKFCKRDGFTPFLSTIEAIKNNDVILFSAELLEMLLPEDQVINDWRYTGSIHEIVGNAICVDYEL